MLLFLSLCFVNPFFRSISPSSDNHSFQCYSDSVCNRSDVVSLFYTCRHFHDVIVKSHESVLIHILWFFLDADSLQRYIYVRPSHKESRQPCERLSE